MPRARTPKKASSAAVQAALHKAFDERLDARVAPMDMLLTKASMLIEKFGEAFRSRSENLVLCEMLQKQADPDPDTDKIRTDLRDGLHSLLAALVGESVDPKPVVQEGDQKQTPLPQEAQTAPPPKAATFADVFERKLPTVTDIIQKVTVDPLDAQAGDHILKEINELRRSEAFREQHPLRLQPLLQALAAETRMVMRRIPEGCELYYRLGGSIRTITFMKNESKIEGFIKGLSQSHMDDEWEKIAQISRAKVRKFDDDTNYEPARQEGTSTKKPKSEPRKSEARSFDWPALPGVRDRIKQGPLIIVGGIKKNEKISLIQERFGFEPEWHETKNKDGRGNSDALVGRIASGKVGAVLMLEGLMGHAMYNKISDACSRNNIPFALADKGGTASLESAFELMEKKLSAASPVSAPIAVPA